MRNVLYIIARGCPLTGRSCIVGHVITVVYCLFQVVDSEVVDSEGVDSEGAEGGSLPGGGEGLGEVAGDKEVEVRMDFPCS